MEQMKDSYSALEDNLTQAKRAHDRQSAVDKNQRLAEQMREKYRR
jgi:hypothetical protein